MTYQLFFKRGYIVIFYILAFAGLCWQVYEVSEVYFSFSVSTRISFNLSASNEGKTMNVRFPYYESFDWESYQNDTGIKIIIDNSTLDYFVGAMNFTNNITVDQAMKYTPSVDDIIDECGYRSVIDCTPIKKYVRIEKYISNVFVVYRFIFQNISDSTDIWDEATAFYSPINYGCISLIVIKPQYFKHVNIIGFFLNSNDKIPYIENSLAIDTDTDYDFKTKKQRQTAFGLRPHSVILYRREPPYVTMCRSKYSMYECLSECVNGRTVKYLNRYAPLKYHKSGKLKQMTESDFKNVSTFSMYQKYVNECKIQCPDIECMNEFTITHIERSAMDPINFYQSLSDSPSFIVFYDAKSNIADYLTLVMSCFGTWFGLSILSFNPFRWNSKSKASSNGFSQQLLAMKLIRLEKNDAKQKQQIQNILHRIGSIHFHA